MKSKEIITIGLAGLIGLAMLSQSAKAEQAVREMPRPGNIVCDKTTGTCTVTY